MRLRLAIVLSAACLGCDLSMTFAPEPYDALDDHERGASQAIHTRWVQWDAYLASVSGGAHHLGPIVGDPSLIDVSVENYWVVLNLGDGRIHLSVWENLSPSQQQRWASWFGEPLEAAAVRYRTFFYEWVALHLAGVETVFRVQGVDWVYSHRHAFQIERDAERMAVNYATERNRVIFDYARACCQVIRSRFDAQWGSEFTMEYYGEHLRELTDPDDLSGYLYFLCRHLENAEARRIEYRSSFRAELEVLEAYLTLDDPDL